MAMTKFLKQFMAKHGHKNRRPKPPAKNHPFKKGWVIKPKMVVLAFEDHVVREYIFNAPKQKKMRSKYAG